MFVSKQNRKKFIDFLEKKCTDSPISNKSLGIMIRSFHVSAHIIIFIVIFSCTKFFAALNLIVLLIIAAMYALFDGCTLTMLEERLCKDAYTLVDPFIELYGYEVNYINRKKFTAYIMVPHVLIMILIYYYRFF